MIQHVVLFKFPQPLEPDELAEMRSLVDAWRAQIDGLTAIRFGPSIDADDAEGYQHLLFLELEDLESVAGYLKHPAHLKFAAWTTERDCSFVVFDLALDDATVILER